MQRFHSPFFHLYGTNHDVLVVRHTFHHLHNIYRRVRRPRRTACKFICTNYTVGERIALPHHVKWARTNNVHHNKMVRKTKPSRPFSILHSPFSSLHSQFSIRHALTQNKRTALPVSPFYSSDSCPSARFTIFSPLCSAICTVCAVPPDRPS